MKNPFRNCGSVLDSSSGKAPNEPHVISILIKLGVFGSLPKNIPSKKISKKPIWKTYWEQKFHK